jgi:hypothetical protein
LAKRADIEKISELTDLHASENALLLGGTAKQYLDELALCKVIKNVSKVNVLPESASFEHFRSKASKIGKFEAGKMEQLYLLCLVF